MKDKAIPDELFDDVRSITQADPTGHDYYRTLRVYRMATRLAELENADPYIAGLGALLHDVDDFRQSNGQLSGFDRASLIMSRYEIEKESRDHVENIIQMIVRENDRDRSLDTIEGLCVLDAIRLDEIGAIGIARAFALGGSIGRTIYDPLSNPLARNNKDGAEKTATINFIYDKILDMEDKMTTTAGRQIASRRHRFMEQFLEEFIAEWNGEM